MWREAAKIMENSVDNPIDPMPGSVEYTDHFALYDQDARPKHYAGQIICVVAATLAVAARLYSQARYRKKWSADDLIIIFALVVVYGQLAASILSMVHGAGLHQVRVQKEDSHPPHGLFIVFINYWLVLVLWAPGVACIKISILIFYRRMFLVNQRWFKVALWVNWLYALGLGIAATFVFIVQCQPINYYWLRFINFYGMKAPEGHCLPQMAHLVVPQILNTFSDVVILLLPVPIIWGLQIEMQRKVPILLIFLLGCFTILCGMARISSIFYVSTVADDVTWNNIYTITFTVVECAVGIVCACLPPSAPLYKAFLRRNRIHSPQPPPTNTYPNRAISAPIPISVGKGSISYRKSGDLELQDLSLHTSAPVWSSHSPFRWIRLDLGPMHIQSNNPIHIHSNHSTTFGPSMYSREYPKRSHSIRGYPLMSHPIRSDDMESINSFKIRIQR